MTSADISGVLITTSESGESICQLFFKQSEIANGETAMQRSIKFLREFYFSEGWFFLFCVACVAGARRGRGTGEIRRALERIAPVTQAIFCGNKFAQFGVTGVVCWELMFSYLL